VSRITPGTLIIGIFAILFGLVGAYAVRQYLQSPVEEPVAQESIRVPLASTDLDPGRELTLGDIMLVSMTEQQVKERELPIEYMSNPQQIIGRILREPIAKGEAFVTSKLYAEGTGPKITDRLKPGLRAVTVVVEGTGLVSGLVEAGQMADVLFRTEADAREEIPEKTVTLLENVEVLAVGQNTEPGRKNQGDPKTVTLAVTPVQASALKVAEGRGSFSLALRTAQDVGELATQPGPATLERLISFDRPAEFTTEIFRAGHRETMTFEGERLVRKETFDLPVAANPQPQKDSADKVQAKPVSGPVNDPR